MEKFKVNKNLEIVCEAKKTRNGFKHEATLLRDGSEIDSTKICYLNRTWERFTFESVLRKLLDKTKVLTEKKIDAFLERASGRERKKTSSQFKAIKMVAKMGEIFHAGDKKATNDWKVRMIKAGLGNKGLIMPEDWNKLSEDEKEKRLENILNSLN